MLDPHPSFESAMEWIRKNLFRDNVYIGGNICGNVEKETGAFCAPDFKKEAKHDA
jgi:uncharacterized membrane protein